jgi:hypothetical protein
VLGCAGQHINLLVTSRGCVIPVVVVACSTQYKTVLDALRSRKDRFLFEDVEIGLRTSVMAFM